MSLSKQILVLALIGFQCALADPVGPETKPTGNDPTPAGAVSTNAESKLRYTDSPSKIPGAYFVVFKSNEELDKLAPDGTLNPALPRADLLPTNGADIEAISEALAQDAGVKVNDAYSHAIRGFSFNGSEEAARKIANDPRVEYVAAQVTVTADAVQTTGQTPWRSWWADNPKAPIHLDRLSQRNTPLDGSFTYASTGTGVTIWILDTGVWTGHTEFGGRAVSPILDCTVANCAGSVSGINTSSNSSSEADCNGHGTIVASNAAGAINGVAKGATIRGIKVLPGCSTTGDFESLVRAIDWVTANHAITPGPDVINISLGAGVVFSPLNSAAQRAVAAGITVVTSAGNYENSNACSLSPASTPGAVAVGVSSLAPATSPWYNPSWAYSLAGGIYEPTLRSGGSCLAVYVALGFPLWPGGYPDTYSQGAVPDNSPFDGGVNICSAASGNSILCPISTSSSLAAGVVSGIAATYLESHPTDTPAQVRSALVQYATTGALTFSSNTPSGSPNKLAYSSLPIGNGGGGGGGGSTPERIKAARDAAVQGLLSD